MLRSLHLRTGMVVQSRRHWAQALPLTDVPAILTLRDQPTHQGAINANPILFHRAARDSNSARPRVRRLSTDAHKRQKFGAQRTHNLEGSLLNEVLLTREKYRRYILDRYVFITASYNTVVRSYPNELCREASPIAGRDHRPSYPDPR